MIQEEIEEDPRAKEVCVKTENVKLISLIYHTFKGF